MQVVDEVGSAVAVAVREPSGVEVPVTAFATCAALPLVVEHERLDAEGARDGDLLAQVGITHPVAVTPRMKGVEIDRVRVRRLRSREVRRECRGRLSRATGVDADERRAEVQ